MERAKSKRERRMDIINTKIEKMMCGLYLG
jgi:hypothetical protein